MSAKILTKLSIIPLILVFSLFSNIYAYNPTSGDLATISQLKSTLSQITSGSATDKRNFIQQIRKIIPQIGGEERISYILQQLDLDLYTQFLTLKAKTKQSIKTGLQQFITQYDTGIIDIQMLDNCTGRYNTIDNISFANNFPTALTIATRYRESHCGYYLPNNGDGPFQILSKNYGTGEINPNIFSQSIQDFIDFSKNKFNMYRSKIGNPPTYTGFTFTGIINHSALYNGGIISGDIVNPNNPKYVYEGYGKYTTGAVRYGILPKFIKFLNREYTNIY